jgi:hypothetical protein
VTIWRGIAPALGRRRNPAGQSRGEGKLSRGDRARQGWSWWYLLFVVELLLIIWPGFYNSLTPTLIGIPFFYWYQLLVVIIGAVLTAIVYFATRE